MTQPQSPRGAQEKKLCVKSSQSLHSSQTGRHKLIGISPGEIGQEGVTQNEPTLQGNGGNGFPGHMPEDGSLECLLSPGCCFPSPGRPPVG